ncbi:unnamed protein product, partial [Vitis vinifera]
MCETLPSTLSLGFLGQLTCCSEAYLVTANKTDLGLCSEIVKACDSTSFGSKDITFICGRAGVCALGAVVVKYSGDERLMNYYLSRFNEIKLPRSLPDELLYGRVGFLWACLFLNKHIGQGTVPPTYTGAVVSEIIKNGIRLANKGRCPLMFEWYGEKYWGAAHGLVGIMHVLMRMELIIDEKEMLKHRGCCSFSHDVMSKVPSSRLWGCFKTLQFKYFSNKEVRREIKTSTLEGSFERCSYEAEVW